MRLLADVSDCDMRNGVRGVDGGAQRSFSLTNGQEMLEGPQQVVNQ
jgi:hypothetical protein